MPWDERTRMDQKVRFAVAMSSGTYSMTELCREFGISRKTGYKWLDRFREAGALGLEDRSRAPKRTPHEMDATCAAQILEQRRKHPTWGPRKLLAVLERNAPALPWPAASSAGDLLKREGLVVARSRRRALPHRAAPVTQMDYPNETWTCDFKGEFRLGNGELCYPLTIRDGASRALLACSGQPSTQTSTAREVFEETFLSFGLPEKILSDGGVPFAAATSVKRLSSLSVWWIRLGITPVLTQPGRPDQNGAHEQMHRILKAETTKPPCYSMEEQQVVFDAFREEYDAVRPHEGIGMRAPFDLHTRSPRPYPSTLPELVYPGHYEVRRVHRGGEFQLHTSRIFLSVTLAGELIGLVEEEHQIWSVYFGPVLLGRYNERAHRLHRL